MEEKNKKNLKNIIGTVVFLLIAAFFLMSVSYILRPTESDTARKRVTGLYAEEKNSVDVVSIGSSSAYRYFNNPYFWEKFGITSYNWSSPHQAPQATGAIIDEVEKTQSPQLYIVEVRKFVKWIPLNAEEGEEDTGLKNIELRRVTDNMKYSLNRFRLIETLVEGDWQERLDYHLDIIRYHSNWENLDAFTIRQYYDNERDHELKGWSNTVKVVAQEPLDKTADIKPVPIEPDAEEALRELLEECKGKDVQIIFVATPWSASNEDRGENLYIGNIVKEYGFEFYNGNEMVDEIGLDYDTDFFDPEHVNTRGSEKFMQHFGEYIVEKYQITPSAYSDEVVAKWNKCLKVHAEDIEKRTAKLEKKKKGETQ